MALHTRGVQVLHASAVARPRRRRRALRPLGHREVDAGLRAGPPARPRAVGRRRGRLRVGGGPRLAVPLPFSLHLRPASIAYFDAPAATPTTTAATDAAPLARIVVLERAGAGEPPSASAGSRTPRRSRRCWPTPTASTSRRARLARTTAERYLDLVARVPVHVLRFRPGFDRVPALLGRARVPAGVGVTRRLALTAWLTTRMLAWRLALPVLKRVVPLPRLVRLMAPAVAAGPAPGAAPDAVLRTARRMYRPRVPGPTTASSAAS